MLSGTLPNKRWSRAQQVRRKQAQPMRVSTYVLDITPVAPRRHRNQRNEGNRGVSIEATYKKTIVEPE